MNSISSNVILEKSLRKIKIKAFRQIKRIPIDREKLLNNI
jgi:hypothetical protein